MVILTVIAIVITHFVGGAEKFSKHILRKGLRSKEVKTNDVLIIFCLQSNRTRRLGGSIIVVGVGQFETDRLLEIAGGLQQFVFQVIYVKF